MLEMVVVLSGPQGKLHAVHKALEEAGFRILTDANGAPTLHNWGHPDSHETEWTGARYSKENVEELGDQCRCLGQEAHAHEEGDLVWGTGEIAPKKAPHPVAFVTVIGEHLPGYDQEGGAHLGASSRAAAAVESFGWRERGHWNNDGEAKPNPFAGFGVPPVLAAEVVAMRQELEALKASK